MIPKSVNALIALLGLAGTAAATPVYYTFSGVTTYVYQDGAIGYAEVSDHFAVGQEVNFIFVADTDLPGTSSYAGTTSQLSDDGWGHYFQSGYVGGSAIATDPAAPFSASSAFGYTAASQSGLTGSNGDLSGYDIIRVDHYGRNFSQWAVGVTGFQGQNMVFSGPQGAITREFNYFSLTLVGISATQPEIPGAVPEPGTLALFASGLGLLGLRLRRKAG